MTTMNYGHYHAVVGYDDETSLFHGEVINLRDVITFQGHSVDELKRAFAESVEDYVEFCRTRGDEPEPPFSGDITMHVEPGLYRAMASAARRSGVSLDAWLKRTLERASS